MNLSIQTAEVTDLSPSDTLIKVLKRPGTSALRALPKHLLPFLPYVDRPCNSDTVEVAAPAGEHRVHVSTMAFWLRTCAWIHGEHCVQPAEAGRVRPLWLIDVKQWCVVPSDGALRGENIPPTIRDAIELTYVLDQRYLWVDRLCILQDDGPAKQVQLNGMADIYAGSYFTIVAARASDASERLHNGLIVTPSEDERVKHYSHDISDEALEDELRKPSDVEQGKDTESLLQDSEDEDDDEEPNPLWEEEYDETAYSPLFSKWEPKKTKQEIRQERRQKDAHRLIMELHAVNLINSTWYSRGWTFQEWMFARRKLVFQDDTVNWECHCSSWHEGQTHITTGKCALTGDSTSHPSNEEGDHTMPDTMELLGVRRWPDFHRYARLASLYNMRKLTFPEDVYDAFAGVLSSFGSAFPGGFVSGLPLLFLDAGLLWQPYEPLERREPRRPEHAALPSWSWMGWCGNLHSESWRSGYDYLRGNPDEHRRGGVWLPGSWHTTSTVEWCHSNGSDDKRVGLPPLVTGRWRGVTRKDLPKEWTKSWCTESKKSYFTHELIPDQEFWFPIPISAPGEMNTPPPQHRSRFLHCRTRRGSLTVSELFHNFQTSHCNVATLRDVDGRWAGVLRLNELPSAGSCRVGDVCELIELSAGQVSNQAGEGVSFDEWNQKECPRHEGIYSFVNVMWIRWADGIAYRQAVGRVNEKVWRGLAKEEVDITLG